jgi:hypothetical protein
VLRIAVGFHRQRFRFRRSVLKPFAHVFSKDAHANRSEEVDGEARLNLVVCVGGEDAREVILQHGVFEALDDCFLAEGCKELFEEDFYEDAG